MKNILLTSTALVAFAGAAFAEAHTSETGTTWAADGEFGYNEEVEGGFYFEGGLAVTAKAALDNNITAGISLDVDLGFNLNDVSGQNGGSFDGVDVSGSDFVIFVESETASLYIGDTETAAEKIWSGTTNMEADGFLEVGDVDDGADSGDFVDGVMRGDMTFGTVKASTSFFFANDTMDQDDLNGLTGMQIGAAVDIANFNVGIMYQEAVSGGLVDATNTDNSTDGIIGESDLASDGNGSVDELIGVFASTTFSNTTVKVAYAENLTTDANSTGFEASYPFGPVTVGGFYSIEDSFDDPDDNYGVYAAYKANGLTVGGYFHDGTDQEIGIEGNYDLTNGLVVYAGFIQNDDDSDATETYIAAEYGLGGGATLIAAYGDTGDTYTGDTDEVGNAYEVNDGTTIAVKFTF